MIFLDFETRSTADLIKWGQRRYALDASTQVLCLAWAFDEEEKVHLWHRGHQEPGADAPWCEAGCEDGASLDNLLERIRNDERVEAHNAGFEFEIWNEVLRREFPTFDVPLKIEQLHCSAAKASCLSLPRALGDAVDALGLPHRKQADGRRLINKLSKPLAKRVYRRTPVLVPAKLLNPNTPAGRTWIIFSEMKEGDVSTAATLQSRLKKLKGKPLSEEERGNTQNKVSTRAVKLGILAYDMALLFCEEEDEHRRNWEYCMDDVRAERGLSNACPEMSAQERAYWLMDFRMNQRGVLLDREGAQIALDIAAAETKRLNAELYELTDHAVDKGSRRAALMKWANGRLVAAGGDPVPDTRADTLSFSLHGVPTKAGDEAITAAKPASDAKWEAMGEDGLIIRRGMEICMEVNKTSVAKYKQMLDSVCGMELPGGDDRLHNIMLYNGADRTGRWSGKGVQPHNFVRGYGAGLVNGEKNVEMDRVWEDIHGLDPSMFSLVWGDEPLALLAKACRGALIASPGKVLYAADFNAIEARKLAWMAGCVRLLNLFNSGGDPYCDMGSAIYKRPITKADKPERQMGKKAILGLGYAMGWEKFQATVYAEEGIWLDDEFCQEIVRLYRKEMYPEIPLLWKDSNAAAIAAVLDGEEHKCGGDELGNGEVSYFMSLDENFLHCQLPSGRCLAYLYPQVRQRVTYRFAAINAHDKPCVISFPAKKFVPQHQVRWHAEKLAEKQHKRLLGDPPESYVQPHLSFMGRDTYTKQWKRCGTHGGSLVENYDQASSRDLLAEAMYRVDQMNDFDLLLSIHDEVIAEAPKGACTLEEFEAIMSVVPKFAPGMPITAEGWIGERLRK